MPLIKTIVFGFVGSLLATLAVRATDALPSDVPAVDFHLTARPWTSAGIASSAYLTRVDQICQYFKTCQNSSGAIIDPYANADESATRYYALAVAELAASGKDTGLLSSGISAMSYAVSTMGSSSSTSGVEFFLPPLTEALQIYQPFVSSSQYNSWKTTIAGSFSPNVNQTNNWRAYWMNGQWWRAITNLISTSSATSDIDSNWNGNQASRIVNTRWSLYHDDSTDPDTLAVEVAGSLNFLSLDYHGYSGSTASAIKSAAEGATKTMLIMQDPSGQAPSGGRTDDHCWIDAAYQQSYEIMAQISKTAGKSWQAGQFQEAAELNFNNLSRWQRTSGTYSGSFFVTKNKFDPSERVGYQTASYYSAYGLQMASLTAESYIVRNSTGSITENPSPVEIGGYAFETDSNPLTTNAFAAGFADAGGVAMKVDLRADTGQSFSNYWTSLGVGRFGRTNWDTRLGPSDGQRSTSSGLGVTFAPTWLESGSWTRLASVPSRYSGTFTTSLATPVLTKCQVVWAPRSGQSGPTFTQNFTVTPDGIFCQTTESTGTDSFGVTYPLLQSDGDSADGGVTLNNAYSSSTGIASASYPSGNGDEQDFIMLNTNGPSLTSGGSAVQSSYGYLLPVQATTTDATQNTFIYPRSSSDPTATAVKSSFTVSGSNFSSSLGSVNGTLYVGRTSAGGYGNSIDVNNSNGTPDVTFNGINCNFILQVHSGTVTAVETDTNITGAVIQGHTVNLTAYTPLTISGSGTAPGTPTGLNATAGNTQVALGWNASSGATSYNVYRSTSSGGPFTTALASPSTTSYTDTSVANGTTYYYEVSATNSSGTSANSTPPVSATPTSGIPPVPTGLAATPGSNQVSLTWAVSTGAVSYNVQRSTTSGSGYATIASPTTNSFTDTTATNGTTYYYVVSATNSSGTSANSSQVSATPSALAGPVGYWALNEGSGTLTADSSGNGDNGTLINSPTWVIGILGEALNFNGTSSYVQLSDPSTTATIKPALPVTVSAWIKLANNTTSQVIFASDEYDTTKYAGYSLQVTTGGTLQCNYGTATGGNASQYRRSKIGTTVLSTNQWYQVAAVIQGPTTMSVYVNGVDDGGTYSGTGGAMAYTTTDSMIGSGGNTGFANGTIDEVRVFNRVLSASEISFLAQAPSGLAATAGNNSVTLTWSVTAGASSYNVKRSTTSGGPYTTIANPTSNSYSDTTVVAGTTYYYLVSALESAGESPNSSEVNATPTSSGAPGVPTGLAATAGNGQVSLVWTAGSNDASFNVYRSTSSGGSYSQIQSGIVATSYTDTNVTNGTTYYYVVTGVNGSQESTDSTQASAMPASSSTPKAIGLPIAFTSAADLGNNFWSGTNQTGVTWNSGNYVNVSYNTSNTGWIYNTGSTGASGNHPGTAGGSTLNTFSNVVMQCDVAFDAFSSSEADTIGFYTNINSSSTGAFAVLICPQNSTSFDVRIAGNATPVSGGAASTPNPSGATFGTGYWLNTNVGNGPITNLSQSISTGTFYTVQLVETQNIAADTITYEVNFFTTSGTLLGSYNSGPISGVTSGYNQAGQIGIFTRDKTTTGGMEITNFIAVPGTQVPFDLAADLENNFWSSTNNAGVTWDTSGYVDLSFNSANTGWIYDPSVTPGTGNHPALAAGTTPTTYSSVVLQADVAFDAFASSEADTFGFYTNINSSGTGAFAVLICPQNSTSFDVRIAGNATPTVSGGSASTPSPSGATFGTGYWLNTNVGNGPITNLSQSISTGTFYTVQVVETQNTAADTIDYQVNFFTTGGTLLGSYDSGPIGGVAAGYNQAGQVGIFTRDKTTTGGMHVQNLILNPSP